MQILSHVSGVEALLAYFCATLYRRTLSGESSLMPGLENQLVSGLIHAAVASGLFHQGDWERKSAAANSSLCSGALCHIHYLVSLPTLLSPVMWMHHSLILKYFFRFPPICAISFPHQPQQTIRLAEHTFFCVWHRPEIIDSCFQGVLGSDGRAVMAVEWLECSERQKQDFIYNNDTGGIM